MTIDTLLTKINHVAAEGLGRIFGEADKRRIAELIEEYSRGVGRGERCSPATPQGADAPPNMSNERLLEIGKKNRPPQSWYEGNEEDLFSTGPAVELPFGLVALPLAVAGHVQHPHRLYIEVSPDVRANLESIREQLDTNTHCPKHNRHYARLPSCAASHCPECLAEERDEAERQLEEAEALVRGLREARQAFADWVTRLYDHEIREAAIRVANYASVGNDGEVVGKAHLQLRAALRELVAEYRQIADDCCAADVALYRECYLSIAARLTALLEPRT